MPHFILISIESFPSSLKPPVAPNSTTKNYTVMWKVASLIEGVLLVVLVAILILGYLRLRKTAQGRQVKVSRKCRTFRTTTFLSVKIAFYGGNLNATNCVSPCLTLDVMCYSLPKRLFLYSVLIYWQCYLTVKIYIAYVATSLPLSTLYTRVMQLRQKQKDEPVKHTHCKQIRVCVGHNFSGAVSISREIFCWKILKINWSLLELDDRY